jgi:MYXO-CTERM domain-containing protein
MYLGAKTNYSNVNMAAIGFATLGRFETDAYVRGQIGAALGTQFWAAGSDRDASHVEQAWFDAIWAAYGTGATADLRTRIARDLSGFPPAPCLERDRVNCDEAEIAAQSCVGIDGTSMIEIVGTGHGGQPVAKDIVPIAIRPDTDFAWRSDPHEVNGAASTKMDPRGDWLAAYWLARASELGAPDANLSVFARAPLPYTLGGGTGGGGGAGGGAGGGESADDGCSCRTADDADRGGTGAVASAVLLVLTIARVKRRNAADKE